MMLCGMGWVTVKKEEGGTQKGTAGTQAGGWWLTDTTVRACECEARSRLAWQLLAACRRLVTTATESPHHTLILPRQSASHGSSHLPEQTMARYKLRYLVTEGRCRPIGVMELGWRGTWSRHCGPPWPAWASLPWPRCPGAIVSCWEAAALALILSISAHDARRSPHQGGPSHMATGTCSFQLRFPEPFDMGWKPPTIDLVPALRSASLHGLR